MPVLLPRTVNFAAAPLLLCQGVTCVTLLIHIETRGTKSHDASDLEFVKSRPLDMHPIVDTQYLLDIGYEPTPELPGNLQFCERPSAVWMPHYL